MKDKPLLEVSDLKKWFPLKGGILQKTREYVRAVDGVDFFINQGESLGLVGESGCGKTTLSRVVLRLLEPTEGKIIFNGRDIGTLEGRELQKLRREIKMIFQDPFSSLNPRMKVGAIVEEPLIIHKIGTPRERKEKVARSLEVVGLKPEHSKRFPHEFSGGQRQRIMIAKALILNPRFIICDEPVSALDVSIRSQILNLLKDIQKEYDLTYLFISHDLSVVEYVCDRIMVMYLGKVVESAPRDLLYKNPLHPYSKALLSGIPKPDPKASSERIILQGDVPSPINPPEGCRFKTRCWKAREECSLAPEYRELNPGHFAACHFPEG